MADPKSPTNTTSMGTETLMDVKLAGPLNIILPPDEIVIAETRKLIGDRNIRVEDVSATAAQDPVIVLELLKTANAMFYSGGRPPITSPKTAIVRLGQQVSQEIIDAVQQRPGLESENARLWLEIHRSRCRRASILARMLSEVVIKNFSDECQVAGLLSYIGEMVAVAHFKEDYVKLAQELPRSAVVYRLAQDNKFDVEKIGLGYLRRQGTPEIILFALDREALSRQPERAAMKPVIMAADEMLDSFDTNKWDKLAPGKQLSSKSSLRLLQLSDSQYSRIYERASEYLFSMRITDEKRKLRIKDSTSGQPINVSTPREEESLSLGSSSLQNDIEGLLSSLAELGAPPPTPVKETAAKSPAPLLKNAPTDINTEDFGISKTSAPKAARISSPLAAKIPPPMMANTKSASLLSSFSSTINNAESTEELLKQLLAMLIGPGLFEKSALIVVASDKKKALVVASRGPQLGTGQTILINDPLSPLAECFSKVQSFGNKESKVSPFGSKAFALSPIDAHHDTPVALYADCGKDGSVSFEARRIFRNVVEILNQKLPYLPGGIPLEL